MSNANEDRSHKILSRVTITTWATTVIALSAVVVSIWTGYETRRHNRLSVKPSLGFLTQQDEAKPQYGLLMTNEGLGPAFVKSWEITYQNKPMGDFLTGWNNVRNELGWPTWIKVGSFQVIKAGQTWPIFWVNQADWKGLTEKDRQRFNQILNQLKVEIQYESIYGVSDKCHYH
jgi:hypothetical protein